jgi:NAD(P)-dependent dehydrogenase (short-subunit alcohol dehydrogenase family)
MITDKRLNGKTAIVSGAGSGIGRAAALRLARDGAKVAAIDIDQAGLEASAALAAKEGLSLGTAACDVSDERAVKGLAADCLKTWGRIDILVNVAGIQITKTLENTLFSDYQKMMNINMGGVFLLTREILPLMKKAGSGAIVNIASELAFVGYPELASYTATKGAIVCFTRSVALEAIRYGVRVNCVCPGATDTPIFWEGETDPAKRAALLEGVRKEKPIGRLIKPEEVAAGVAFMASDDASACAGACLVMDGGFTAQ